MGSVAETGNNAEIAAAAPQCPKQLVMVGIFSSHGPAISQHDVRAH
jgi:hypothetical protein